MTVTDGDAGGSSSRPRPAGSSRRSDSAESRPPPVTEPQLPAASPSGPAQGATVSAPRPHGNAPVVYRSLPSPTVCSLREQHNGQNEAGTTQGNVPPAPRSVRSLREQYTGDTADAASEPLTANSRGEPRRPPRRNRGRKASMPQTTVASQPFPQKMQQTTVAPSWWGPPPPMYSPPAPAPPPLMYSPPAPPPLAPAPVPPMYARLQAPPFVPARFTTTTGNNHSPWRTWPPHAAPPHTPQQNLRAADAPSTSRRPSVIVDGDPLMQAAALLMRRDIPTREHARDILEFVAADTHADEDIRREVRELLTSEDSDFPPASNGMVAQLRRLREGRHGTAAHSQPRLRVEDQIRDVRRGRKPTVPTGWEDDQSDLYMELMESPDKHDDQSMISAATSNSMSLTRSAIRELHRAQRSAYRKRREREERGESAIDRETRIRTEKKDLAKQFESYGYKADIESHYARVMVPYHLYSATISYLDDMVANGQLSMLDSEATLASFMVKYVMFARPGDSRLSVNAIIDELLHAQVEIGVQARAALLAAGEDAPMRACRLKIINLITSRKVRGTPAAWRALWSNTPQMDIHALDVVVTYVEYTRSSKLSVSAALGEMEKKNQIPDNPRDMVECTRVMYQKIGSMVNNPVKAALLAAFPDDGHYFAREAVQSDRHTVISRMLEVMRPKALGVVVSKRIADNAQNLNAEALWSFENIQKIVESAYSEYKMRTNQEQTMRDMMHAMKLHTQVQPLPRGVVAVSITELDHHEGDEMRLANTTAVKNEVHPTITSDGLLPAGTDKECPCCLMPASINSHTIATCPIGCGWDDVVIPPSFKGHLTQLYLHNRFGKKSPGWQPNTVATWNKERADAARRGDDDSYVGRDNTPIYRAPIAEASVRVLWKNVTPGFSWKTKDAPAAGGTWKRGAPATVNVTDRRTVVVDVEETDDSDDEGEARMYVAMRYPRAFEIKAAHRVAPEPIEPIAQVARTPTRPVAEQTGRQQNAELESYALRWFQERIPEIQAAQLRGLQESNRQMTCASQIGTVVQRRWYESGLDDGLNAVLRAWQRDVSMEANQLPQEPLPEERPQIAALCTRTEPEEYARHHLDLLTQSARQKTIQYSRMVTFLTVKVTLVTPNGYFTTDQVLLDTGANQAALAPEVYRHLEDLRQQCNTTVAGSSGTAQWTERIPEGECTIIINSDSPENAWAAAPEWGCAPPGSSGFHVILPVYMLQLMGARMDMRTNPPTCTYISDAGHDVTVRLSNAKRMPTLDVLIGQDEAQAQETGPVGPAHVEPEVELDPTPPDADGMAPQDDSEQHVLSARYAIPSEEEIACVINGAAAAAPRGTVVQNGPFNIENLDPRGNDQKPLGTVPGVTGAAPLYNKESFGYTLEDRPDITPNQRRWIIQEVDKLRQCFAASFRELTGYTNGEFDIEYEDESQCAYQRWRKLSGPQKEFADKICQEMLDEGIIEGADDYVKDCANVVIAPKKDPDTGQWTLMRFCVDLRQVNDKTKKMPREFPIPEDMFREIGHHKFYCTLDLKAGFHQIRCSERAKRRLTFWWNGKPFRFTRMPFGAVNSPAVFQNAVERELTDHQAYARVYIDDVIMWGDTVEEMMAHLQEVLASLDAAGLKAHPGKTTLFASGIEYLGFMLTADGIQPQQVKVEAIRKIPRPETQADISSFLGLITYYRWFIQKYSQLAAPLRALTKKGANVLGEWSEVHEEVFITIKDLLCTPGVGLKRFDPKRLTFIHTDWSKVGLSAVLTQYYDEEDSEYLVLATSRSCNKHETRYPPFYGEMLASTWGVNKLRPYIYGMHFTLVTDHRPITYLLHKMDGLSDMHQRWQMQLQEYSFDIIHRAGKLHQIADVPSRHPLLGPWDNTGACLSPLGVVDEQDLINQLRSATSFMAMVNGQEFADNSADAVAQRAIAMATQLAMTHQGASDSGCAELSVEGDALTSYASPWTHEFDYVNFIRGCYKNVIDNSTYMFQLGAGGGVQHMNLHSPLNSHMRLLPEAGGGAQHGNPPQTAAAADAQGAAPELRLKTKVVDRLWFDRAVTEGLCLLDLCGNIATMLDAVLRLGWKIKSYTYVDTSTVAAKVANEVIQRCARRYPLQLPRAAYATSFSYSQDITKWTEGTVTRLLAGKEQDAWLVSCGWPCQDNSPAGLQKAEDGNRSILIKTAVVPIIQWVQQHAPNTAYVLENVAIQHNWKHKDVWKTLLAQYDAMLGQHVCFDAVKAGSAAHRVRNWWQNLCEPGAVRWLIDRLMVPTKPLALCFKDVRFAPVVSSDKAQFTRVNFRGMPRVAMPTYVAYPKSRAFRLRDDAQPSPGMVQDIRGGKWREPYPEEKIATMGHDSDLFGSMELDDNTKTSLVGLAWDMHAVLSLLAAAESIQRSPDSKTLLAIKITGDEIGYRQAYYKPLDDFRDHQLSTTQKNLMKNMTEDIKRLPSILTPVIPLTSSKANRKRGLGCFENLNKHNRAPTGLIGQPQSGPNGVAASGTWWEQLGFRMGNQRAQGGSCVVTMTMLHASEEQAPELTRDGIGLAMANAAVGHDADLQMEITRWDPWEAAGRWVYAYADPMGPLAKKLAREFPSKWRQIRAGFVVEGSVTQGEPLNADVRLWRLSPRMSKQLVPRICDRINVARELHEKNGHWGVNRTTTLLAHHHWWPKMRDTVTLMISRCGACQKTNASFDGHRPVLKSLPIEGLCYRWSVDLAIMPYDTIRGNKVTMIAVENYSKFMELIAMPTKESSLTAAAFRDRVIARYGGCAEVITDNGGEFEGDFDIMLERNFIDHRLITAQHSQSNGLAERCVQTVKRALSKMAETRGAGFQWDDELAFIQLGYNCSVQESTRLTPYAVMLAHQPIIPSPAAGEQLKGWAALETSEFDSEQAVARAAADLEMRMDLFRRFNIVAGDNLKIAQHRDQLRYASLRSGGHRRRTYHFRPGDFVWVKRKGNTALEMKARGIYQVVEVRDTGVLILKGSCGTLFSEHMQFVGPCHVTPENIGAPVDLSVDVPAADLPCEICQLASDGELMLICDHCSTGWHMFCLSPPLESVPDSTWYCPACTARGANRSQRFLYTPGDTGSPKFWADGRLVMREASLSGQSYHGRRVKQRIDGKWFPGVLQFLDDPADSDFKGLFRIAFDDHDETYVDLRTVRKDPDIKFLKTVKVPVTGSNQGPHDLPMDAAVEPDHPPVDSNEDVSGLRRSQRIRGTPKVLVCSDVTGTSAHGQLSCDFSACRHAELDSARATDLMFTHFGIPVVDGPSSYVEDLDADYADDDLVDFDLNALASSSSHLVGFTQLLTDGDSVVRLPAVRPNGNISTAILPDSWDTADMSAWQAMLDKLLPDPLGWPKGTVTRMANAASVNLLCSDSPAPAVRHITSRPEIEFLEPLFDWSLLPIGFDPFGGTGVIKEVVSEFSGSPRIMQNDVDLRMDTDAHSDALQPGAWRRWKQEFQFDFVITSPYFALLDFIVPLMHQFTELLIVHVPINWAFSSMNRRTDFLKELHDVGKLRFLVGVPKGSSGMWQTCWLAIAQDASHLAQVFRHDAGHGDSNALALILVT